MVLPWDWSHFVPRWEVIMRHNMFCMCVFSLPPDCVCSLSMGTLPVFFFLTLWSEPLDPHSAYSEGSVNAMRAYHVDG